MARSKDKPPPPICKLVRGRLIPASQWDEMEIQAHADGTEFDMVARTARSNPQHGTYWKALAKAVEATGRWPTSAALHVAIKIELGRVEPVMNMAGKVVGMRPDSTSFEAMGHREFCVFMDQAMRALAEAIGYDPLAWMNE